MWALMGLALVATAQEEAEQGVEGAPAEEAVPWNVALLAAIAELPTMPARTARVTEALGEAADKRTADRLADTLAVLTALHRQTERTPDEVEAFLTAVLHEDDGTRSAAVAAAMAGLEPPALPEPELTLEDVSFATSTGEVSAEKLEEIKEDITGLQDEMRLRYGRDHLRLLGTDDFAVWTGSATEPLTPVGFVALAQGPHEAAGVERAIRKPALGSVGLLVAGSLLTAGGTAVVVSAALESTPRVGPLVGGGLMTAAGAGTIGFGTTLLGVTKRRREQVSAHIDRGDAEALVRSYNEELADELVLTREEAAEIERAMDAGVAP
jgi:hypothetical protein